MNLHLPATRKIAGKWDPASRKVVGQVERSAPDAIQLRIIPAGIVEDPATATYDYPAVDGLILQRVSETVEKPTRDAVLSGFPRSPAFDALVAWHKHVAQDEIRTSWFVNSNAKVAMVCTAQLQLGGGTVTTSRQVFDWATQNTEQRKLARAQSEKLKSLAAGCRRR